MSRQAIHNCIKIYSSDYKMQMRDWGEQGLIDYLTEQFVAAENTFGIGDDAAAIFLKRGEVQLVTTDALIEGIHFQTSTQSAHDLGYKTIAVNVSDIAAKGGRPLYGFIALAIPPETEKKWLVELISGLKNACQLFGIHLLGGDTVGSKRDLFINFTLIGKANQKQVKYRTGAEPEDIICVTGNLGDSLTGLKALEIKAQEPLLIQAHVHPYIYLEEGIWLSSQKAVHAMMDLSDGLDSDLKKLINASKCGATLDVKKLPLSNALQNFSNQFGFNSSSLAIAGGEDYCLLFTVAPKHFAKIAKSYEAEFKKPFYPIGYITDELNQLIYLGKQEDPVPSFSHFSSY